MCCFCTIVEDDIEVKRAVQGSGWSVLKTKDPETSRVVSEAMEKAKFELKLFIKIYYEETRGTSVKPVETRREAVDPVSTPVR